MKYGGYEQTGLTRILVHLWIMEEWEDEETINPEHLTLNHNCRDGVA